MSLKVIAAGQAHDSKLKSAIEDYQKRCRAPYDIEWVLVRSSEKEPLRLVQDESSLIARQLNPGDYVILLDERGNLLDSPALSNLLSNQLDYGKQICLVIGGAYGVSDELRRRADYVWSLSPLVFPHQLVRLILVEQLYRAQEIGRGGRYHHK